MSFNYSDFHYFMYVISTKEGLIQDKVEHAFCVARSLSLDLIGPYKGVLLTLS